MIKLFSHYISLRVILLVLIEGLVIFASLFAGVGMRHSDLELSGLLDLTPEAIVFAVLMVLMMSALGLYDTRSREAFRVMLYRLMIAFGVGLALMSVIFYLVPETYVGRGAFLLTAALAFLGVLLARFFFFRWTQLGVFKPRLLVLGTGADAALVEDVVMRYGGAAFNLVGFHPLLSTEVGVKSERIVPIGLSVREAVRRFGVDEIVIAVRERRGGALPWQELLDCRLDGVRVTDLSSFFERETGQVRLESLKASWLIFNEGFRQDVVRETVKRVFDVAVSLFGAVVATPVIALTALAILLEDGPPVLFRQKRVGQGGVTFDVLKFRSMRRDAERDGRPQWAREGDERITRVGRFIRRLRIDEVPQLFNVLKGEMSFVGPRPERPFFVRQLSEQIPFYAARHSVKPGITGWAQVRYPYGASTEDAVQKLQYDLYYVKNHTLFLDLLILVQTVHVVLFGRGAR